jgi:uncharacterized membrane-anchored protein
MVLFRNVNDTDDENEPLTGELLHSFLEQATEKITLLRQGADDLNKDQVKTLEYCTKKTKDIYEGKQHNAVDCQNILDKLDELQEAQAYNYRTYQNSRELETTLKRLVNKDLIAHYSPNKKALGTVTVKYYNTYSEHDINLLETALNITSFETQAYIDGGLIDTILKDEE